MQLKAVLTADIVNSTALSKTAGTGLIRKLNESLAAYKFEFYRGDSFQVYMPQPARSLHVALLCRIIAMNIAPPGAAIISDVRISIGLGTVSSPVRQLRAAKGEAFILSGRAFDTLSLSGNRLAIAVQHPVANEGLQVIVSYMESLFRSLTSRQVAIIYLLLSGLSQQNIAKKLRKSKSTISQHVAASRWEEITHLLTRYENIINQLT